MGGTVWELKWYYLEIVESSLDSYRWGLCIEQHRQPAGKMEALEKTALKS